MAGSTLGRIHADRTRLKIKTSSLINRLQDHVLKGTEMSSTQIQAARILLAKTLPDLKTAEITGSVQVTQTHRLSDQQLMSIAAGAFQPEAIEGQSERLQERLKLPDTTKASSKTMRD
jgi:hypothetical protein